MVSYYHQVFSHTVFSLTHSPTHVIPVNTSMVSYYHQVFSLTLTHSLSHPCHPTHTPMVSYYHQVITLTALRELVLPLTLPWCRTTTKSTHSLSHCLLSHTHSHGVVLPPSHHTPTPILVLPLTPIYHVLTHSAPLTSFHLLLATNASQMHHQCITNHLPHSPTHHASIASSSLPITNHYQPPPIASSHSTQHS